MGYTPGLDSFSTAELLDEARWRIRKTIVAHNPGWVEPNGFIGALLSGASLQEVLAVHHAAIAGQDQLARELTSSPASWWR